MEFDWGYTVGLLTDQDFWKASLTVVELSVLSWLLANVAGVLLALMQGSRKAPARWVAQAYVWFFRSLPLLVLLVFMYNLPQLVPAAKAVLASAFSVGVVSMVLNESAFMAELYRGGLMSVSKDQREAAAALGLRYNAVQRRVVIPQAFRIALPGLFNEFISILKLTSLVSTISLTEILLVGQRLYTSNFKVLETLTAVAVYYVLLVTIFDLLRRLVEARLDVGRRTNERLAGPQRVNLGNVTMQRPRREHAGTKVVHVADLNKSFGSHHVLKDVNLDIHAGEVVVIVGPSGSGKTTLLRTMNHLETVDSGRVEVDGELMGYRVEPNGATRELADTAVARQRQRVGMVFQRFNLFPHLTAVENVMLAPRTLKHPLTEDEALELLHQVGMREHARKYPHALSGGQQQRVAIARALAMKPDLLLFDEPTSALDPEMVGEVLRTIAKLADEGRTMVVVTHEMRVARHVADWVIFMEDGSVVAQGHPTDVLGPKASDRVKAFLSEVDALTTV